MTEHNSAVDFSAFRIAFDHLTKAQNLESKQVAALAIMFYVGIVNRDEGPDTAKVVILQALTTMGPPFCPAPAKGPKRTSA